MILIIILAIFLVPMSSAITIPGTIVWWPQVLALQLIGGICFSSRLWKLNRFIALFVAYLSFSYIFVTNASPRTLLCLMIGYAAISITLSASKLKDLKWTYRALIAMSLLSILYPILQMFGIDPIFIALDNGKKDIVGFAGSHNQLGVFSCANAFWSPFLIPISVIPILLGKSISGFIGLMVGGAIYIWFRMPKVIFTVFIFLIIILGIYFIILCGDKSTEYKERTRLWSLSIKQIITGRTEDSLMDGRKAIVTTSPWFGFGLGNFFVYSPMSQYKMYGLNHTEQYGTPGHSYIGKQIQHFYEHAHNDLVEALYEFGYTGFLLIIGIIGSVVGAFIYSSKTTGVVATFASLVAQSVASCSIYIMHAPLSLFVFCLTLGLFYAEVGYAKQSKVFQITT
jgi:hypothetical protein